MKYIILLRGINVGGKHKVDMDQLKNLFLSSGFRNVSTYINTGNIILESDEVKADVFKKIKILLEESFDFPLPLLVKTKEEFLQIAEIIPPHWQNNKEQKTDVAFLFDKVDSGNFVENLPVKKDFLDIIYTRGALVWNVKRNLQNKSQLSKLAGHRLYSYMTLRNVNTVRKIISLLQ